MLTLKEEIFSDHTFIIYWKIELEVRISSRNVSGKSAIMFRVNFPPRYGHCTVNPELGSTKTQFIVKCPDWIDLDGSLVNFAYYGKGKFAKIKILF